MNLDCLSFINLMKLLDVDIYGCDLEQALFLAADYRKTKYISSEKCLQLLNLMNTGATPPDLLISLIPDAQISQNDLFLITSRLGLGQLSVT